jgi:hypothetical protein
MNKPDMRARATCRTRLSVVLTGLTMISILAAASGSAEAGVLKTFLISPTTFDFGDVPVGTTSAQQTVTIMNVSSAPVVMSGAGGAAGQFGGGQECQGTTLNPGQSCHIFYAFTPAALGPATGSTSGSWNGQGFSFTFAGNGTRRFLISPTAFDFGNVPLGATSAQQTVTITNVSSAPVVMSGAGGAAGHFGGGQDCQGTTLNPGQSCHIFYAFTPAALGPAIGSTSGSWNGQSFSLTFVGNGYKASVGDLDADGKADPAVYRPSTGQWLFLKSGTNYSSSMSIIFGLSTDLPVPGDYDGDGKTDLAVFRPSTGQWFVLTSSSNFTTSTVLQWGTGADVTVPGDYDGDGKTDIAVFRPSNGTWYIVNSKTATTIAVQWGSTGDVTVPGDYDGDGKTDVAVFRPSNGVWYIKFSSTGTAAVVTWGTAIDLTVPGDYDGDGRTDVAVYRPSTGQWFVLTSSSNFTASTAVQWGTGADVTVPSDYDGDGKTDIAVFRPSNGTWYILNSSTGTSISVVWGTSSDIPIPETYLQRWLP